MDDDHIITMVFDDIANNTQMPEKFKGQLFNTPGGIFTAISFSHNTSGLFYGQVEALK